MKKTAVLSAVALAIGLGSATQVSQLITVLVLPFINMMTTSCH